MNLPIRTIKALHFGALFILLLAANQGHAQTWINSVTPSPALPTECEPITVQITGNLPASNYFYDSSHTVVLGNTITIHLYYGADGFGLPVITPFTHNEPIGFQPANLYTLQVILYFNTNQADQVSQPFRVLGGTANLSLGPDTTLCHGEGIILSVPSSASANYLWSTGATTSSIWVDSAGTYWVSVTVGTCAASDTITITYHPPIVFSIGNDTTICRGDTIQLEASVPGASYLWSDGSTTSTYNAYMEGHHWAEAIVGHCKARDSMHLAWLPPLPFSLGNDTTICTGDTLLLEVAIAGGSYHWYNGSTAATAQVYQAGTYWVEVTDGQCTERDSMTLGLYPEVVVDLGNDTALISIIILDAGTFASYIWSTGATTQTIEVDQVGTYSVTVTDQNGCIGVGTINVYIENSIHSLLPNSVIVYPNPGTGFILVETSAVPTHIRIVDLQGRVVRTQQVESATSPYRVSLEGLPPALYLVQVHFRDGSHTVPVVKE